MINAKYLGLTANQLAETASKLDAENAKLRTFLGGGSIVTDYWKDDDGTMHVLTTDGEHTYEYIRGGLADENAKLRELMYERSHVYAIQNMTEDELRITTANVMDDNAKLREAVATALKVQAVLCRDADRAYCRKQCPLHRQESDDCLACDVIGAAQELGIEV